MGEGKDVFSPQRIKLKLGEVKSGRAEGEGGTTLDKEMMKEAMKEVM